MATAGDAVTETEATEAPVLSSRFPTRDALLGVGVFALALVVYNRTLTPSLSYSSPDGAELATVPHELGLAHMPGYPLYTFLGKAFTYLPVGDVAHRMNLMSAVGAAGAAALVYGICRVLRMARPASLLGALLLAFSLTFWSQAVIAEVYAPNAFMLSLTILLLLAWGQRQESEGAPPTTDRASRALFYGFALAFGLSLGTHLSNAALAGAAAVYVVLVNWRVLRQPTLLAGGAAFFLLGAAQYVWLPIRAATLNDPLMVAHRPDSWDGFLNYTVRAFSNLRLAFPLSALPDRVLLYMKYASENFRVGGLLLPLIGLWGLLFRRTKPYFLLVGFYTVEVAFFTQYAAFDLDVFFIPAHLVTAVFAAYAFHGLLQIGPPLLARVRVPVQASYYGLAALALVAVVAQVGRNWDKNDRSRDTAINDFYRNVFDRLPAGATLVGGRGVFGYDMFYFREVENLRPDVSLPLMEAPSGTEAALIASAARLYTTVQPVEGGIGPRSPFSGGNALPPDRWYVPVLAAPTLEQSALGRRSLILYEARAEPPKLIVPEAEAHPEHVVDHNFGGLTLVGYEIDGAASAGGTLHVALYWRMAQPSRYFVTTQLGGLGFETHELGFGNLTRLLQQTSRSQGIVVEQYDLVVLSSIEEGEEPFTVGVGGLPAGLLKNGTDGIGEERLELTKVRVEN